MRRIVFSIVFSRRWLPALLSFQVDEIETEFLHANRTPEFSHSLGRERRIGGELGKAASPQLADMALSRWWGLPAVTSGGIVKLAK